MQVIIYNEVCNINKLTIFLHIRQKQLGYVIFKDTIHNNNNSKNKMIEQPGIDLTKDV